ncbi:MAG: cytochrome P450 [Actinomycetota bacterium]|nr:cytochrome P450 [Actinomycetota bacterium]
MTPGKPAYDSMDLSTLQYWARSARERDEPLAVLRTERPVSWHPPAEGALMDDPNDLGYWAVVRHADVVAVSKAHEIFASSPEYGGVMFENVPAELLQMTQSILAMDEPQHGITRRLISAAFSPRQVRLIGEQIQSQATAIVDELIQHGPHDFVEQVSALLPLWTISEMLGVPASERGRMVRAVEDMVGWNDPEYIGDSDPATLLMGGIATLHDIAQKLVDARRATPADDLMSALVTAEVSGNKLSDEELCSYFCLLAIAGNDTTRNTISHALMALADNPDQKALLLSDFDKYIPTAIEEFLRWGSVVMTFRRTARADTEIAGQQIAAGDKVVMFYSSANRDESVFPDPWKFDLTRHPNPHVAFGGGGVHFCLGSHVARTQMRALFGELLTRIPTLHVGHAEFVTGNFMNAVKRLPIAF